jgi:hypothetical protein
MSDYFAIPLPPPCLQQVALALALALGTLEKPPAYHDIPPLTPRANPPLKTKHSNVLPMPIGQTD